MNGPKPSVELRDLAREVGRLRPDWQNPERYFERRDEVRHRLHRLAEKLEGNPNG